MYWICNYKMDSQRKHFIFLLAMEITGSFHKTSTKIRDGISELPLIQVIL